MRWQDESQGHPGNAGRFIQPLAAIGGSHSFRWILKQVTFSLLPPYAYLNKRSDDGV